MVNLQREVAERGPEAGLFGGVFGRPGRVVRTQINRLVDVLSDDLGDLGGHEVGGVHQVAQVAAIRSCLHDGRQPREEHTSHLTL